MKYEVTVGDHVVIVDAVDPETAKRVASEQTRPMNADDMARGLAQGAPILGAGADEANAVTNAFLSYVFNPINELTGREYRDPQYNEIMADDKSFGERVMGSWEAEKAKDERLRAAHPAAMTGLNIAGSLMSMGGLAKSAPELTAHLFGSPGKGFFSNLGRSALTNTGIGGTDAFLRSDKDFTGRLGDAAEGAAVSGLTSLAAPLATKTAITAGSTAASVAQKFWSSPNSREMAGALIQNIATKGPTKAAVDALKQIADDPDSMSKFMGVADELLQPQQRGQFGQYLKSILGGTTAVESSKQVTGGHF